MLGLAVAIAVVIFCLGVLVGSSIAEQLLNARFRRQAEMQRLLNERTLALEQREEMQYPTFDSRSRAHSDCNPSGKERSRRTPYVWPSLYS